jgi:superoxide reductase
MIEKLQMYKCEHCGNIAEVFVGGGPVLACCGTKMTLLEPKTADAATEKHVPVIEKIEGGYKVTVGSTLHPMTDEHYIQWIELICGDVVSQVYLKPGDAPEAIFHTGGCDCPVTAREHCNVHGLWKG